MRYLGFDKPSFAFKSVGSAVGAMLSANFTTGTYKLNDTDSTFADLFTFNRAGKAWLVKESGLVEYAVDVPRFDNGLLIEQSATNLAMNSNSNSAITPFLSTLNKTTENYVALGRKIVNGLKTTATTSTSGGIRATFSADYLAAIDEKFSLQITLHNKNAESLIMNTNVGGRVSIIPPNGYAYIREEDIVGVGTGRPQWQFRAARNETDSQIDVVWGYIQYELTPKCTSYIYTTATPVTRPADYLLNKITGTTVTGDWDSTLTLSIIAGKLVHSGYGRIRTLEIN